MEKRNVLYALFIISLMAIFAFMVWAEGPEIDKVWLVDGSWNNLTNNKIFSNATSYTLYINYTFNLSNDGNITVANLSDNMEICHNDTLAALGVENGTVSCVFSPSEGLLSLNISAYNNSSGGDQLAVAEFNLTFDRTAPTVTLNDTQTLQNYTWTTDTTPSLSFNFTDDNSPNATCRLYVDGSTVATNQTVALNSSNTIFEPDSALPLGTHTWGVNCTDLGGNTAQSSTNFTLDVVAAPSLTAPDNDTWVGAAGTTNYTANGVAFIFSFSSDMVANAGTGQNNASCELLMTNSSGEHGFGNNTVTLNGTSTTITNNVTLVEQVNHTWYINCTYNGTIIQSEVRNLNVDATAPTVSLSDTQTLQNYTWTTDTTPSLVYNFTELLSPTASCELFVDETSRGVNSSLINATTQTWTNTTALSVGTKTWYVNCTDEASNVGTSLDTSDSFVLDVVSPISVTTPGNNSWTSEVRGNGTAGIGEAFTFSFISGLTTGNDTNTDGNVSCELWITNASGVYLANGVNTSVWNNTATTIYNNQTLVNGLETNWTINCTYNSTQITATIGADYFALHVDNATPSVTVSSADVSTTTATLTATTGSELTDCWYSTSNGVGRDTAGSTQMGQPNTASHSTSLVSLSSGTTHTRYVRCWDRADNPSSVGSTSFTTTAAASGSGGGGSGGGVSSGATGDFAQRTWASINAGETASVEVVNGEIGVTEVSFAVKDTAWGAWLKVEKVDTLPSTVSSFPRKAYRNIKISENNVQKALKDKATISFKVAKSWLTENKIGQANVALYRFVGKQWVELSTSVLEDDGVYIHYSAETSGFSYFLIGMKDVTAPGEAPTEPGEVLEEVPEELEGVGAEPAKTSVWMWLIPLIVALVVIVWLVWFKKKK